MAEKVPAPVPPVVECANQREGSVTTVGWLRKKAKEGDPWNCSLQLAKIIADSTNFKDTDYVFLKNQG